MAALYRGLALGNTALIAPTAAVLGALTPVLFGIAAEGLPSPAQLAGFAAGMGGIWLVTRGAGADGGAVRQGLLLAVVAGVGFGGFFVAIGQTGGAGLLFFPLAVAKATGFVLVTASLLARKAPTPAPQRNPIALLAGVLDAGGSIFYMLARAFTRLDVAAVLSSMYPVVTVILASLLLRETITRVQWLGIALCVLAVTLIII
jgi:drug/metabolite transporter (DMT)-like permease